MLSKINQLKKRVENTKKPEPQVYQHIYIDAEVGQELKEWCAENKTTMKDVTTALVEDFLIQEGKNV